MGKVASCHRTSLLVAAVGFLVFGQVIDSGELEVCQNKINPLLPRPDLPHLTAAHSHMDLVFFATGLDAVFVESLGYISDFFVCDLALNSSVSPQAITIDALAFHCLFSSFNLPAIKPTPTSVVTVQYAIPFRLWERPS